MNEKNRTKPDFEAADPPILTERMLEAELERRKLHRQTALLAAAGILLETCLMLLTLLFWQRIPLLALCSAGYLTASVMGAGILTVVYHMERRNLPCRT